ncbi:hypothetical protein [Eubacterium sp.]
MAEFKSSFIGGYSKKSVNEYVSKLENENDILKKALDLAEHNALKADKYYNENTKLNNEIAQLNEVVAELNEKLAETEKSNNDYIASIGQIFYSAYESGAKITDDATAGSQEFLQKIEEVSAEAKAEAQKALTAYNLINTDIKALLTNLTKEINAVSANTDAMIKKATEIATAMDSIQQIKTANADKAQAVAEEYKEFFDSFQTETKGKATKTEVIEVPVAPKAEPVQTVVQETEQQQPIAEAQAPVAPAVDESVDKDAVLHDILNSVSNS